MSRRELCLRGRYASLVSENIAKIEVSDAEKAELRSKVFTKLRKKRKFLKFLRAGQAILLIMLMFACAPVKSPEINKDKSIVSQITEGFAREDRPEDFEKVMPESKVALSSVVKFSKEYPKKLVGSDVIDFDFNDGFLVLLKEGKLESNLLSCPSILLDGEFVSVRSENGLALVMGTKRAVLADFANCGILYEIDSRQKGFSMSDKYFLEFKSSGYEFYDSRRAKRLKSGGFIGRVLSGHLSGGKALFSNESGKVALMDVNSGKYAAIFSDKFNIKSIYFDGAYVYVYDADNRLIRLRADYVKGELVIDGEAQAKDGCKFMKRNGYLLCDDYIFGVDDAYLSPLKGSSGMMRERLLFMLDSGSLYAAEMDKKYQKSLKLTEMKDRLCLKNGKAYFTDFDGSVKYVTASGTEKVVDKMPKSCDHRFSFKDGALKTPDGREIYRFASVVNSSEKASMLKRKIGDDSYYYFEMK